MHWTQVDDQRLPRLLAGHPALEFCNTWAGWGGPPEPRAEWLGAYPTLAVWAGHAGLVDRATVADLRTRARAAPEEADDVLAQARELRAAAYATLLDGTDRGAFDVVRRYAERAARAVTLTPGDGRARWTLPADVGLPLPVLAVAWSVAELLGDPRRATVRACPGNHCGWLFLDPRGRRKWCSMATCGNRAKVNAYLQRHA